MNPKLFTLVTLLSLVISLPVQATSQIAYSPGTEEHIQSVENGLKKGIVVKGQEIDKMNILNRMQYYKVPGISIAVVQDGKIEWAKAYNTSTDNEVTIQTLFQAGSISKPVSAVAALSLVEKNKLNLDENVNDILQTWKVPENQHTEKEKVTLRRLLSHTAGLTVHGFEGYSSSLEENELPTIIQTLNGEKPANNPRVDVANVPGQAYSYSGGGYIIAQAMMEDVTQGKFYDLAHEFVFKPLKMNLSTYKLIWPQNISNSMAVGHSEDGNVVPGNWNLLPESTAAGLWTTPSDLGRFIIEVQDSFSDKSNKILSTNTVKEMLTKQPNSNVGLGFAVNQINPGITEFSHGGVNVGYVAYFVGFAQNGQGAIIMTNSINGGMIIPEIIRSIADAYQWPNGYSFQYKVVEPVVIDPLIYQNYVGQFEIDGKPIVKIMLSTENNKLFITLPSPYSTSDNKKFELIPESETRFFTAEGDFEVIFSAGNNDEFTLFGGLKARRMS